MIGRPRVERPSDEINRILAVLAHRVISVYFLVLESQNEKIFTIYLGTLGVIIFKFLNV